MFKAPSHAWPHRPPGDLTQVPSAPNGEAETQVPSAPNGEAETQEWFCVFMYLRCQVSAVGLGVFRFSVHTGLVAPQPVRSWFPGQGWNPRPPHCRVAVNRGATRGVLRDESADQQCTLIAWRPNKNSQEVWGGPRDAVVLTSSLEDSPGGAHSCPCLESMLTQPRAPQHARPAAPAG